MSNTRKLFESFQKYLKEKELTEAYFEDELDFTITSMRDTADKYGIDIENVTEKGANHNAIYKLSGPKENLIKFINDTYDENDRQEIIKELRECDTLTESVQLPEGYETFTNFEIGNNYNSSQGACKLNAMKAYLDDNNEDIYVGSVKVNGKEITHFFNVKDGKVIDHSGTANTEGNQMSDYKGVNVSGVLKAKGYTPYLQRLQYGAFQNENGDIIEVTTYGNKPAFFLNKKQISYEDLKNLNEAEEAEEDVNANGYCETLKGLEKEIKANGGLYGLVSNHYDLLSKDLLREIALNAIYELNNDDIIISDLKERYYEYGE